MPEIGSLESAIIMVQCHFSQSVTPKTMRSPDAQFFFFDPHGSAGVT